MTFRLFRTKWCQKHLRKLTARQKPPALKLVLWHRKWTGLRVGLARTKNKVFSSISFFCSELLSAWRYNEGIVHLTLSWERLRYQVIAKHFGHCAERPLGCSKIATRQIGTGPEFDDMRYCISTCLHAEAKEIDISSSSSAVLGAEIDKRREETRTLSLILHSKIIGSQ